MSERTPVILVTGPPASGKTSIAARIAADLRLPLVAKDEIKEVLYEALGVGDVEWSRRLGRASIALVQHALELHVRARQPVVVEANFVADVARPAFVRLRERHPFVAPLEINCTAREEVLVARYRSRIGTRHAGHLDAERVGEITAAIRDGRHGPLELGGACIVFDTEGDAGDLDSLIVAVREHLAGLT